MEPRRVRSKIRTDALLDESARRVQKLRPGFRALDRKTGAEIWQKDLPAPRSPGSPALVDGKIVVGSREQRPLRVRTQKRGRSSGACSSGARRSNRQRRPARGSLLAYIGASDLHKRVDLIDAKDTRPRRTRRRLALATPCRLGQAIFASAIGYAPYQMRHLGSYRARRRDRPDPLAVAAPVHPTPWSTGSAPVVDGDLVIVKRRWPLRFPAART